MAGSVPLAASKPTAPRRQVGKRGGAMKWVLITAAALVLLWLIVLPLAVVLTEALGSEIVAHVSIEATPALTEDVRELAEDAGDELGEEGEASTVIVGRLGAQSRLAQGDPAELVVDTSAVHFFDLETGAGIYDGTKGAS